MSVHIEAAAGDIAERVLLPGDPLRAKFIAENYLTDVTCYNKVRGMLGFTGLYKDKKVSVQGTGMGQPSMSIYATELFKFYGVKTAIRIGTIGSIQKGLKCRDIVLSQAACSDSALINRRFGGSHFSPTSDFQLLLLAYNKAKELGLKVTVGTVATSDLFYDDEQLWKMWARYGVLGMEMESAEFYTLAKLYNAHALAIYTVSDNIATGEETTAADRQSSFTDMMKLALETAISYDDSAPRQ